MQSGSFLYLMKAHSNMKDCPCLFIPIKRVKGMSYIFVMDVASKGTISLYDSM